LEGYTETAKQMKEALKEISQFEPPEKAEVLYPQPRPAWQDKLYNWRWDKFLHGEPSEIKGNPYTNIPIQIEIPANQPSTIKEGLGKPLNEFYPPDAGGAGVYSSLLGEGSGAQNLIPAGYFPQEQYEEQLVMLQDYKDKELDIVSEAEEKRHQVESHFSDLTRRVKKEPFSSREAA
jgi:hypothetical protein